MKRGQNGLVTIIPLLKQYPLALGPQCPWEHTKIELQNIIAEMEKEPK